METPAIIKDAHSMHDDPLHRFARKHGIYLHYNGKIEANRSNRKDGSDVYGKAPGKNWTEEPPFKSTGRDRTFDVAAQEFVAKKAEEGIPEFLEMWALHTAWILNGRKHP